jgi:hypothetical protein
LFAAIEISYAGSLLQPEAPKIFDALELAARALEDALGEIATAKVALVEGPPATIAIIDSLYRTSARTRRRRRTARDWTLEWLLALTRRFAALRSRKLAASGTVPLWSHSH